jgi:hypothetical protein
MSLTIITGWSPEGWRQYAHRFADTFNKYWPRSVKCIAYTEEPQEVPNIEVRSVLDIPGCREFIEKYRDDKRANCRDVQPNWKQGAKDRGYNFRFDAWKFSRQGFIPWAAWVNCPTRYMAWFDADVITTRPVPEGFIESLLPEGKAVAYLGREPKHSEIGFQLYDLEHPSALAMLRIFRDLYASEAVFQLKEWHSAYAWDHARREASVPGHNLTPNGHGNVWIDSPLRQYTDHLKGKRKHA